MLQPREADVPALFVVFIVLPVIAYFLLGRWHDSVSKKTRVGVLGQKAAEEAFKVETMACPDVILPGPSLRPMPYLRSVPSLRSEYHECATCRGPAKTRCSRCKSVRYCSGKCQIIHWRQGHKQTCQQWHVNGGSNSGGLSPTESSEQMPFLTNLNSPLPGGDSHLHDMNFDTVSEPSFATTDSYILDTDLFLTDRSNMNESNQSLLSIVNSASVASCEKSNYSVDEETNSSEILSANKVSNNSYGCLDEKNGNHDFTYPLNNTVQQPNNCAPETTKCPKASITVYEPDMGVYFTSDMTSSCEGPYSSATESLQRSKSSCKYSGRGNAIYMKPPYPPGKVVSSQKTQEVLASYQYNVHQKNTSCKNEQRSAKSSVSTNNNLQGCTGISKLGASKVEVLKKPSKFLKTSLVGLINDNKRSKVLFCYEDLVKFFQYEVRGISPRGLFNCGNSCYANAVLQCLMCTKPLMIHLLLRLHSKDCCSKNWCLMCELEQYASTLRESGGPVSPSRILSNLRNIGCRLGGGSQEDAHEFLRHLVMSMQAACLDGLGGEKQVEQSLQETTLIQQMFGGRLKSKVTRNFLT
ncbi:unnamed protein product [Triticum turgidum subsp. durum]|uniref:Ubiquitinyl hydrolase 1 n=1 Tax=Triticum turgidum subsp. durum TaxID=4567 RepID=A0A9R1AZI1_TRITD|nr:unnamed protein product [Triticum turgidum subsp. durum]